jgi:hypothetical protein
MNEETKRISKMYGVAKSSNSQKSRDQELDFSYEERKLKK